MTDRLRVQFIHGLEGSPQGSKARFLAEHFEGIYPRDGHPRLPGLAASTRRHARSPRPRSAPSSARRSAVPWPLSCSLATRGAVQTLLLAQAALKLGRTRVLPAGVPVILVHGVRDDVVPFDDSRALAATGSAELVKLIEVDDDRRLQTLVGFRQARGPRARGGLLGEGLKTTAATG